MQLNHAVSLEQNRLKLYLLTKLQMILLLLKKYYAVILVALD